jgi:aminoglycoside 6'-N-acetyltransferase-1b/aminoglycoside 6'-N-acetyltransferase-2
MPIDTSALTLRLMTENDLGMLHEWLNRPHIAHWWSGESGRPTLAEVQEVYLPRALAKENVTPYIAMLDQVPVAYAQSYVVAGSGGGWWEDETDPGLRGIDQSIADPELLGQGLGTRLVRALVGRLFSDPSVTRIQTDPSPQNLRAIRCYQRAGFRIVRDLITPDGPAVYMVLDRIDFVGAADAA